MLRAARYFRVGTGLTLGTLLAATAVSVAVDWSWALVTIIGLASVGAVALAFAYTAAPPTTSTGIGSWNTFSNVRGSGLNTVGGGLVGGRSGLEPASDAVDLQTTLNCALPLVVAALLLVGWLVF